MFLQREGALIKFQTQTEYC